jgi:hypothetical protein
MTDAIGQYAYDSGQQEEEQLLPEQSVRMLPPTPMGSGTRQRAQDLLDLGARYGARGLTNARIQQYFGKLQDLSMNVALGASREMMDMVDTVSVARLNEVVVAIGQLQQIVVAPQQGLFDAFRPRQIAPQGPAYVSLDAVKQVLAAAIAAASTTSR